MSKNVIVVGAGGAGLVAALSAHEAGAKVKVITKEYPTRSQTCMAQGGINAALGNAGEDSVDAHIQNTLKSAHGLANEDAVAFLCQSAPKALEWLDGIGVPFSRTNEQKIAQRKLGGASAPRACYAQDYTGLKMLHTLYDRCVAAGIEFLNERHLLDLLTHIDANKTYVSGVLVLNKRSGEVEAHESSSVILATGGYSRVFHAYSTNSIATSGDGVVAALRAGAVLSDLEFIQFHPTAMKSSSILVSESARGAGGYLLNSKGERFTNELAPRDKVARAIHEEILKGESVFLDIRHLGREFIEHELPQEAKLARLYEGVDPVSELIPIRPAAHYTMGGIDVDAKAATRIKGLFAAGECANHRVHGANRLGGNSLLELVVFGKVAGEEAARYAKEPLDERSTAHQKKFWKAKIQAIKTAPCQRDFYEAHKELGELFYRNVGIWRDAAGMQKALACVKEMQQSLGEMGVRDQSMVYNTNLTEFLEFANMLELSELILLSALAREESRGAHFRIDVPQSQTHFERNTLVDSDKVVFYEDKH